MCDGMMVQIGQPTNADSEKLTCAMMQVFLLQVQQCTGSHRETDKLLYSGCQMEANDLHTEEGSRLPLVEAHQLFGNEIVAFQNVPKTDGTWLR